MAGPINASGRAAMHCSELVARSETPDDGLGKLAKLGEELAPLLAGHLESLFMVGKWDPKLAGCELMAAETLAEKIGPVAGNFLLPVGDAGGRLFASFPIAPLAGRLARMFGGESFGEDMVIGPRIPSSVVMLLKRLEQAMVSSLAECIDDSMIRLHDTSSYNPDFARMNCFPPRTQAAVLSFRFKADGGAPVEMLLACRKSMMARLLANFDPSGAAAVRTVPEFLDPSIGSIPLPVRVQLSEMKVSARRLMSLKPGSVLPIAVPRSVPLMVSGQRIALGSIGEQDDRVAIQIEQTMLTGVGA